MAGKLNLVLAILAAGLGLVLWLAPNPDAPPKREVLTSLERSDISRISIAHPDAELIVLEKAEGQWRLTAPLAARADDFQVGNLLELAGRKARASYAAGGMDLTAIGLNPPRYKLRLDEAVLGFGDTDPLDNQRYVRVGERVHLISDLPPATLDANPVDLIDKRPLPPDMQLLAAHLGALTLKKTETGGWEVKPAERDQGADAAQALIDAWARARASVVAELPENAEFAGELRFYGPDREIALARVKGDGLVLARRDLGLQYHFAEHMRDSLFELQPPDDPLDLATE